MIKIGIWKLFCVAFHIHIKFEVKHVTGNFELVLLMPGCINIKIYNAIKYVDDIVIDKAINAV